MKTRLPGKRFLHRINGDSKTQHLRFPHSRKNALCSAGFLLGVAALPSVVMVIRGQIRPKNKRGRFGSIVVLGTAQYDGVPSRQFAARLQWAAEQWQTARVQKVITVGGNLPGDRFTEAHVGREYLLKAHVDSDLVVEISHGNDTWSSLKAVQGAVKEPVIIVTDPNHALRSELIARLQGMKAVASPTPYSPARFPSKPWWLTVLHETGGLFVVTVSAVCGRSAAVEVETRLRDLQAKARPSRRARIRFLKETRKR
ncbi:YdcF family protein [Corynebacterium silvaticum]|uniref:YdcF family protein n=1 Tax=Corynebacterium silvaticum TaxID=2320431 RepID=UPI00107056F3|nr:YdcF family protein [Corynebacterium silvaticum]TFA93852.1 YdcF family protein [Corynebacterium silvaticum]